MTAVVGCGEGKRQVVGIARVGPAEGLGKPASRASSRTFTRFASRGLVGAPCGRQPASVVRRVRTAAVSASQPRTRNSRRTRRVARRTEEVDQIHLDDDGLSGVWLCVGQDRPAALEAVGGRVDRDTVEHGVEQMALDGLGRRHRAREGPARRPSASERAPIGTSVRRPTRSPTRRARSASQARRDRTGRDWALSVGRVTRRRRGR